MEETHQRRTGKDRREPACPAQAGHRLLLHSPEWAALETPEKRSDGVGTALRSWKSEGDPFITCARAHCLHITQLHLRVCLSVCFVALGISVRASHTLANATHAQLALCLSVCLFKVLVQGFTEVPRLTLDSPPPQPRQALNLGLFCLSLLSS